MFYMNNKFILLFFLCPSVVFVENLQYLISEAVNTNPLVMGGIAQDRSAEVGIETARWQFFSTPSINIQTAVASDSDPKFQGDDWVATASLSQLLWTGGRLTAGLNKVRATYNASHASVEEIWQQIAQRHAAQAKINAQRLFVNQQVSKDYARLSSLQQRLTALQASVPNAKHVSMSYDRQFLAGQST
jgi:outer membrane protein TolC